MLSNPKQEPTDCQLADMLLDCDPRTGARRYSYDTLKVLQRVWAASGGQCGKCLAASMPVLLENRETPRPPSVRSGPLFQGGA